MKLLIFRFPQFFTVFISDFFGECGSIRVCNAQKTIFLCRA